jgi:glycosyltransferase involved in cell wall biosynthesis
MNPRSLPAQSIPVTVLVAARNEEANIARCITSLKPAARVVVLDSGSTDKTQLLAETAGADVIQFVYHGGYPKKRQWAIDNLSFDSEWILLVDADEQIPPDLWLEIRAAIEHHDAPSSYFIRKGFHFLGRRFTYGGFSFDAILLFRLGCARFEHLVDNDQIGLDMEIHERLITRGATGRLRTPLIHDDFKGLASYIDKHNKYSSWEAHLRTLFFRTGRWGLDSVQPKLFGNPQERRRFLKFIALRMPFEPTLWFMYHYVVRGGFLEGIRGYIACRIRSAYIASVRAKIYERRITESILRGN